ncbi:hypothetical protein EOPP23_04420 [Endozoicomonas sp. OPT23]|uniref:DUF3299 domain-containing protein n=1 Tax=Endozoicomonas sp. OPT23 TaxID=2072845 RepID=UPI00129AA789|nr:DUF3299 domain-containing protein [Endozoicomonas sp. OPT23]MRI32237.1 hypothetical protein [Endozoicomonas sp. OPT23]
MIKNRLSIKLFAVTALLSLGISSQAYSNQVKKEPVVKEKKQKISEITWEALMPPPEQSMIDRFNAGKLSQEEAMDYMEELGQIPVQKLNSRYVKIPGYLVPLNLDKNQKATELLLVPSAGSCVHVPPPPPNQTIFVRFKKGIKVTDAGYVPYWLTGTLKVEKGESKYTDTLYAMTVDKIEEYK